MSKKLIQRLRAAQYRNDAHIGKIEGRIDDLNTAITEAEQRLDELRDDLLRLEHVSGKPYRYIAAVLRATHDRMTALKTIRARLYGTIDAAHARRGELTDAISSLSETGGYTYSELHIG